jgi:cytochrome c-type biogenesis protein CcmE
MNRRTLAYALGTIALLVFAGFTLTSFRSSLTQYVSFQEAQATSRTVQVAGGLEHGSGDYSNTEQALRFTLVDPESQRTLRVRYHGLKPANFEDAVSIVAIGRYESTNGEFAADKLLVKCPSKYQGSEVEEKVYS